MTSLTRVIPNSWIKVLNLPVATEHFLGAVANEHLKNDVDLDDRMVVLEGVGEDESIGRSLEDGKGMGSTSPFRRKDEEELGASSS